MEKKSNTRGSIRRQNIVQTLVFILIIVLLNVISARFFFRADLTAEKRHSITNSTKKTLKEIDDVILFKVYLEGDLPAELKKLRNATREMLDGFRAHNRDIEYEFINPYKSENQQEREALFMELMEKGVEPTNVQMRNEEGTSTKLIFPAAIVVYKDREMPVQLLMTQSNLRVSHLEQINNSIEGLEYNLLNTIRKLTVREKPKVAFLQGHGELNELQTADLRDALSEYYEVSAVELNEKLNSLSSRQILDSTDKGFVNRFDALIVAKPQTAFSHKDQFILDQFIMRGGKVLWLLDPVVASLDSLQYQPFATAFGIDLGLQPMLANYGARINYDLIQDINALPIPVNVQPYSSEPRFEFFPWFYHPIIVPERQHPIVRNLDAIKGEFMSSIDTISSAPAAKTILLTSSTYSRSLSAPLQYDLEILGKTPDERDFNRSHIPVAVLLEGEFNSLFRFRSIPGITDNPELHFLESGRSKMIVISDGDMARNQITFNQSAGKPVPQKLGYDKWTDRIYANKPFLLNAMNYLCDDEGVLELRSRELKMRLLDQTKFKDSKRTFWQLLNVGAPLLALGIMGLVLIFIRRRRFAR
jgi:ABC-2 type transport system permease protein